MQAVDTVAFADPEVRTGALQIVRSLITRVTVLNTPDGVTLELEGALSAMIGLAQNDKTPHSSGQDVEHMIGSVKVVAGTGFEPVTFRL